MRRHGVSNRKALLPDNPAEPRKAFKACAPGFLHVDVKYLPQMADETARCYLFAAIDRATRWVFAAVLPARTAANARRFLRDLHRACPIRIARILTDRAIGTPLVRVSGRGFCCGLPGSMECQAMRARPAAKATLRRILGMFTPF